MTAQGTTAGELPRDRDAAVTALFVAYQPRLVGLARLLVDDQATAEDVVQDAFTSLYRRWPWMRSHDNAYAYLRTSVANGARSSLRRRRTAREARLEPPAPGPSAETNVVRTEEHSILLSGLHALPRRQRQVLVLRYYLDLSEAEIAETLAISRGSVKQHASRALSALTSRLEAQR
jgi:RNA polymerase sigma-70 factor (sigma-E family)